jgi:hypothetical protein
VTSAGTKPPRRRLLLESHLAADACYDAKISSEIGDKIIASIAPKNVAA